jgi:hypothetical protein
MGKQISDQEYAQAKRITTSCTSPECRNHTRNQEHAFCRHCVSAYKTVKEYERAKKRV